MIPPRVKAVVATDDYCLIVTFDNGIIKQYNMQEIIQDSRFHILKNKAIFKTVRVDAGGYSVSWDSEMDLSENELWVNGTEIRSVLGEEISVQSPFHLHKVVLDSEKAFGD